MAKSSDCPCICTDDNSAAGQTLLHQFPDKMHELEIQKRQLSSSCKVQLVCQGLRSVGSSEVFQPRCSPVPELLALSWV